MIKLLRNRIIDFFDRINAVPISRRGRELLSDSQKMKVILDGVSKNQFIISEEDLDI